MKTDTFNLTQENVAGYNATMQSAAMQQILAGALAADRARKQSYVDAAYNSLFKTTEQIAEEEAASERYRAMREEALERGWGD